jgi:uncharacterized protein YjiS (DUF1127 family)
MTALDTRSTLTPATTRPALGLRVVNAGLAVIDQIAKFHRAWRNRREIYRLGEMSDAQLADIGLARGDLHVVWQTPIGVDPTEELGRMSQARMRAYEALARRIG